MDAELQQYRKRSRGGAASAHSTQPLSGSRLQSHEPARLRDRAELRPRGAGDGHGDRGRGHRGPLPHDRPEPARARQHGSAALARPLPGLQQLDPRVLPVQPRAAPVRGHAARPRRAPGLPGAPSVRARAGRGRVLHPAESGQRPLLALELLGSALQPARGAERHLGLPRGHRRLELAHERALRREPLLPPRGQPLDRDAAGADRHDHRRGVRVPSQAARRLPRGAELVGARDPVADRVGLPPVPRHPRAVPHPDPEGVLPAQLLGRGGRQRAGDRGDRGPDRRRPDVRVHRLPALRLELPRRVGERAQELLARDRRADPDGRRAPLRVQPRPTSRRPTRRRPRARGHERRAGRGAPRSGEG